MLCRSAWFLLWTSLPLLRCGQRRPFFFCRYGDRFGDFPAALCGSELDQRQRIGVWKRLEQWKLRNFARYDNLFAERTGRPGFRGEWNGTDGRTLRRSGGRCRETTAVSGRQTGRKTREQILRSAIIPRELLVPRKTVRHRVTDPSVSLRSTGLPVREIWEAMTTLRFPMRHRRAAFRIIRFLPARAVLRRIDDII